MYSLLWWSLEQLVIYAFYLYNFFVCLTVDSPNSTLKIHHGGKFDEYLVDYIGGEISYFDMCSARRFYEFEIESMLTELGLTKNTYDLWYFLPEASFDKGLLPIITRDDNETMLNLLDYGKCVNCYITKIGYDQSFGCDDELQDISFTQMELDQREERVTDIRENKLDSTVSATFDEDVQNEEYKLSFHGD